MKYLIIKLIKGTKAQVSLEFNLLVVSAIICSLLIAYYLINMGMDSSATYIATSEQIINATNKQPITLK